MLKIASILLMFFVTTTALCQIVDKEHYLRDKNLDSLNGWEFGGLMSLTGSQVSLTNWNVGGQNSISLNGLVSVYVNYSTKKAQWENSLDLVYGILRQGKKNNAIWLKTDDKIDMFSKFGRRASEMWYYSALLNFNTQSTVGYNYPNDSMAISRFMAPGYLLSAAGMEFKPNKMISAVIAPITMKTTFVMDQSLANQGAFGVQSVDTVGSTIIPGKRIRFEMGGYVRFQFQHEIFKNVNFTSKLGLFSNYLERPERIDVNWENLLQFKVNRYISATISTHLIYDDDIDIAVFDDNGAQIGKGPRLQFKEVLGIGLSFKFPEKKIEKPIE